MTRDELVEKMLGAYWQDCRPCETCEPGQSTGMSAALSVAIEELLKPVDQEEYIQGSRGAYMRGWLLCTAVLGNRCANLIQKLKEQL